MAASKQVLFAMTLFLAVILWPAGAKADCSNPASVAGEQVYNTTYKTMQFCDGTNWYSMKGGAVNEDTLADLSCSNNQIVKWNGSAWVCSDGADLTNLNASNLTSGTVPISRIGTGTKNIATILRGDNNFTPVPNCDGTDKALNFNAATGVWSCVTIEGGGGGGGGSCVIQSVSWSSCSGSTSVQNPGTTITVGDGNCCSILCGSCTGNTGSAQFKCEDDLTWTYLGGGSCSSCTRWGSGTCDQCGSCGDGDEAREDLPWAGATASKMKACFDGMLAAGNLFSRAAADPLPQCGEPPL